MSPDSKKKSSSSHSDNKKIISVTMSESLVEHVDKLVNEGVARSRAQMIEDAVRWFIDFTVHKWGGRGIYIDSTRVVLESDSQSSLFFSKLTPAEQYELGITAGSQSPIADIVRIYHDKDPSDEDARELVLRILQEHGWGEITKHDDKIVIGSPFYPAPFIHGYLKSLLDLDLELVETHGKENVALRLV
ncbi:ribbon-helix-helix protein, CopG family [Candidatus Thorarchaeota archaeon]|nr:MAG: ribbon-helix-helix protein, CopG family [Candidatus Thorarchaeota archaeon]